MIFGQNGRKEKRVVLCDDIQEESQDPPAFKESMRRAREQKMKEEHERMAAAVSGPQVSE
jgi:hypothetical protein